MRFRLYKIVLLSDIEKAFLQIGLQPADRDVTRFPWLKDKDKPMSDDNIQVMRFCRVPFGVISSPFLLGATVDYHLKKNSSPIAEEIRKGIYVDNVLSGASSLEEAREIYKRSKSIFAEASMNLREWTSNSQEFLSSIPECDRVALGITKVLGIRWNTTEDVIILQQVDSNDANTIPGPDLVLRSSAWQAKVETKREVLKFLAQYFDPLGYYLPVTVRGKLLLRTLWDDGLHWDDKLLPKHSEQWEVLKKDLAEIQNHSLPRLVLSEHTQAELSLLCFVDASQSVYATAVYLHTCSHDNVITNLIFAKSRLSPKKLISIPRLELMAVLIGIRSLAFVEKELRLRVKHKILWSDSQCALHWIQSKKPLPVFINNRVKEIRAASGVQFRYMQTADYPADLATRGKTLSDLRNVWWEGPQWLNESPNIWPQWNMPKLSEDAVEQAEINNKTRSMYEASMSAPDVEVSNTTEPFGIPLERFSSLNRLIRVTAWCQRFINRCKNMNIQQNQDGSLAVEELAFAQKIWERYTQENHFPETHKKLSDGKANQLIRQLDLRFDDDGIIRCYGRISKAELDNNVKWPKLLPKESYLAKLVIQAIHKKVMHTGVAHTLSQVRHEYWIPQGRSTVRNILRKCLTCRKGSGGPFRLPQMPDLPSARTNPSPPFTYTGLDYFGPLFVKHGNEYKKVWVCMFTCLTVRAVHLEIAEELSASQFLTCLRRFIARRGRPLEINCDNAPQFKVAKSVTDKLWKAAICSQDVKDQLSIQQIRWKFITELAPWMGGHYERLVAITKQALKKCLGKLVLTINQLSTILAEVEATVNSRPLTYVGDDFKDGNALTPAQFLCLNPISGIVVNPAENEDPDYANSFRNCDKLIQNWRKGEAHLASFWQIWSKQYLLSLRESLATQHKNPRVCVSYAPKLQEIVLIKDPSARRGTWKLGRVEKLIKGCDGVVRSAEVRVPSGKSLKRSIGMLYPLECDTNTSIPIGQGKDEVTTIDQSVGPKRVQSNRAAAKRAKLLINQQLQSDSDG